MFNSDRWAVLGAVSVVAFVFGVLLFGWVLLWLWWHLVPVAMFGAPPASFLQCALTWFLWLLLRPSFNSKQATGE